MSDDIISALENELSMAQGAIESRDRNIAGILRASADLRADRDSLHDALAALVKVVERWKYPSAQDILSGPEYEALESARHVLGEPRA